MTPLPFLLQMGPPTLSLPASQESSTQPPPLRPGGSRPHLPLTLESQPPVPPLPSDPGVLAPSPSSFKTRSLCLYPPLTGHPPNHSISACRTMSPMPVPASASVQPARLFSCSSRRFRRRRAPRPGTSSAPMAPGVLGPSQLPAQGPPPRSTQRAATVA